MRVCHHISTGLYQREKIFKQGAGRRLGWVEGKNALDRSDWHYTDTWARHGKNHTYACVLHVAISLKTTAVKFDHNMNIISEFGAFATKFALPGALRAPVMQISCQKSCTKNWTECSLAHHRFPIRFASFFFVSVLFVFLCVWLWWIKTGLSFAVC